MPQATSQSVCRVLLVEDNEPNAIYATAALMHFGCEVSRATDGDEAVQLAEGHDFSIIFMDYHMTRMNGLEATTLIRKSELARGSNPVPIIGLTASAMEQERDACLRSGMVDVLLKPFLLADLQCTLTKWTGVGHRQAH